MKFESAKIMDLTGTAQGIDLTSGRVGVDCKILNQNGTPSGVFIYDGLLAVVPYFYLISDGKISGHTPFFKMGYNADVDNVELTNTPFSAGIYVFPTAAMQMEVVSSAVADAAAGTGARTVKLSYLDTNYSEQSEIITLNGQTAVPTVATNILRVNSMQVETVGTGLVAAGNIDIRHTSDTPVYGRILANNLSMRQMVYTVPAGKSLFLTKINVSSGSSLGAAFCQWRLRASVDRAGVRTTDGRMFTFFQTVTQDGAHTITSEMPIRFNEKVDVRMDVVADAANSNAVCTSWLQGWIED